MQIQETLIDLLKLLFKNRKIVIRNVLIATGLSVVVSLFMKNYYESTSLFYPTSPDIMKPEFVFGKANKDMEFYGTAMDLDRLLTIGNSTELYNHLIDTLKLYEKYKIDSSSNKAKFKVIKKFKSYYKLQKTKLDAIELSIEDHDPVQAAVMAKATTSKINDLASDMMKRNLIEMSKTLLDNITEKQATIQKVADSLSILRRKYDIIDPNNQAEMILSAFIGVESRLARDKARLENLRNSPKAKQDSITNLAAMVDGLQKQYNDMTDSVGNSPMNLRKFNEGRNVVEILDAKLRILKDYLALDQTRYDEIQSVLKSSSNAISIVETATVPLEKSRPKRSLIVLGVMAVSFLFSLLGVIVVETLKDPKWKQIWHD